MRTGMLRLCIQGKHPMNTSNIILDPTNESAPIGRRLAVRARTLSGRVGIIDISKPRGDIFCDEIARLIAQRLPGIEVFRVQKPTFTKPAPPNLRQEVASQCNAVIQALAD